MSYECALSGKIEDPGYTDDSDGLGDLPPGWTKITITRRQVNPKWVHIRQVRDTLVTVTMTQVPPEHRAIQRIAVELQVEAQFFGLEQATPMYLPDIEEEIYLSDSPDILDEFNEIREMLGLEPLSLGGEEEDDDDDDVLLDDEVSLDISPPADP